MFMEALCSLMNMAAAVSHTEGVLKYYTFAYDSLSCALNLKIDLY